jgi:glycosyltransferase involved in cell wall biosynthesis
MQIVAVIGLRNEEAHIANLLRDLKENNICYAILDNASTDSTLTIAKREEFRSHLVTIAFIPFDNAFDLTLQLTEKMALIESSDADWVIHLDADEILHSYRQGESLNEAITRTDAAGFNVIDFNEFVFLPVDFDYEPDRLGHQPMRHYYFFERAKPPPPHRMIAWKRASGLSMIEKGGHKLVGADIRLSPEKMAMRHYIFCSQEHAFRKYAVRRFAPHDLARGWHRNRVDQHVENFRFPSVDRLCFLETAQSRIFDRSRPVELHYWEWQSKR